MKLIANAIYKNRFYKFLPLILILVFNFVSFGQSCADCSFCEKPFRCVGIAVSSSSCEQNPICPKEHECRIKCYPVSDQKSTDSKVSETGLLTLYLITNEYVTSGDLDRNPEKYAALINSLLNNKVSDNSFRVQYNSKQIDIGFTEQSLILINKFKRNLEKKSPNARKENNFLVKFLKGFI